MYIHIFDCKEEGTIDDMIVICDLHRATYLLLFTRSCDLFYIKGSGILYAEGTISMVCWLGCSSRVW